MKKIFVIATFLFLPMVGWGQTISIDEIDIDRILSCATNDLACQAELETTRVLIQALLVQILTAQQLVVEENQDVELAYWETEEYLQELEEEPLRKNRSKSFRVRDGVIEDLEEEHAVYQELWRMFSLILGEEYLSLFEKVKFYNSSRDQYAALVYQEISSRNGREDEEWELEINLENVSVASGREYNEAAETMAHEAGHVLLMNNSQMEFFVDAEDCDIYYVSGLQSCAREGSYYDALEDYWDQDFIDWGEEFLDLFRDNPTRAEDRLAEYYEDHPFEHVTEYAASGPDEDAAETIAHFAVDKVPTGSLTVAEEKIIEMYNFDELVDMRSRVQSLLR